MEESGLAFYDGKTRHRTYVSKPEDGGAVGDDRDRVRKVRVGSRLARIITNRQAFFVS